MSERLVFTLGPPRCGKSLLAQLLEAHPRFTNADESRVLDRTPQGRVEESAHVLAEANRAREALVAQARGRRPIETTPGNAYRLPFIRLAFPDADYIVVDRDRSELAAELAAGRLYLGTRLGKLRRLLRRMRDRDFRRPRLRAAMKGPSALTFWARVPDFERCRHLSLEAYDAEVVRSIYESIEEWFVQPKSPLLIRVSFDDLLTRPAETAARVIEALGEGPWDGLAEACARIVRPQPPATLD